MPKRKTVPSAVGHYLLGVLFAVGALGLLYFLPPIHRRLAWRLDALETAWRMRNVVAAPPPTPRAAFSPPAFIAATATLTYTPTPSPTAAATDRPFLTFTPTSTFTPTPTPTPIPAKVVLKPPAWESQDWNNCGPATLAMYLRWWGWKGDQYDIDAVVKPKRADRNVNVEELAGYVNTRVKGLTLIYRVGGTIPLLKKIIASGMPVMIEEGMHFEHAYWRGDDHWGAHYLLLTGYDDETAEFISQDSFRGPNRRVHYSEVTALWEPFNHVYILVFPPRQAPILKRVLGSDWDEKANREHALAKSEEEVKQHPKDPFAWFNLGTNLLYFEKYADAAAAYDRALEIGLPQRFLRYQFGPFIAYFRTGRIQDLLSLTDYALKITPNSEEAHLWRGWAYVRLGRKREAIAEFRTALKYHPGYPDALYALRYLGVAP